MNYNTLLVKYKNSWQLRTYQFTIKSDIDNELDSFDVFPGSKKSKDFEKTENEIDKAFSNFDEKYHLEGRSAYVSVNRSKNKIYYYSRSNDWVGGYFCTFTIDPKRYDSFDFKVCSSLVRNFLNYLRNFDSSIYALIVPEKHKSGAYHFHGLISPGIEKFLKFSGHVYRDQKIYNCSLWKYGFSNITKVQNALAVEKYICKYTSKELLNDLKFQHRYFTLHLREAEEIKLNLYNHQDLYKELCSLGLVLFCNTDGQYNRVTYSEIKNTDEVLNVINKYVNMTNDLIDSSR